MESWPRPTLLECPGASPDLRLYDTATRQVRPTATGQTARMYVCGITPYDATHLGHAFTYLVFDVIQRIWRDSGREVDYVQNVTDIDDPLLERAVARGEDWREIARRETQLFRSDMSSLGVIPPDHYLGAVESIPSIVTIILGLRDQGAVYRLDDDWYFDISQAPRFGEVSGLPAGEMLTLSAERGGDPGRPGKRNPLDPLMWQAQRPDEPAWDTELGHGRPGWHIECVAIALDHLGMSFDVQGGGSDLIFPHHEMGAAHAGCATGKWPYARHYVHTGMVGYEGFKMSKSRGNLVFVSHLLRDGVEPSALRIALLDHPYRSDWEWDHSQLERANRRLDHWRAAAESGLTHGAHEVVESIRERISDDLDIPSALSAVDRWAQGASTRRSGPSDDGNVMATALSALVGVELAQHGSS